MADLDCRHRFKIGRLVRNWQNEVRWLVEVPCINLLEYELAKDNHVSKSYLLSVDLVVN